VLRVIAESCRDWPGLKGIFWGQGDWQGFKGSRVQEGHKNCPYYYV
jgi:hypothetical protein